MNTRAYTKSVSDEMAVIFRQYGIREVTVRGETLYQAGMVFRRLISKEKTILLEAAVSEEEVAIGRFDDFAWYDCFLPQRTEGIRFLSVLT